MTKQSCRTCKWLERPPKPQRLRSYGMYWCNAPIPEKPKLPDAVLDDHTFIWPTKRGMTCPNYGANCPAYEKA